MPQCELCGREVDELTKTKVSGAEINVCSNCTSHGTTLEKEPSNNTDTKYSTSSGNSKDDTNSSSDSTSSNRNYNNQSQSSESNDSSENPFDDVSDLAIDYGQKIQTNRSQEQMSREDLAKELGIKESYLRHIENEETQPSVELQQKIERELDIDLSQTEDLGER